MTSGRPPRDAQRSRVYRAETPLPSSPLPGLPACAAFADRVVGSLWWQARFPDRGLDRVPRFRPGNGARQAFYREDPDGPTITLPRRYRTKGVVLHELAHWALARDDDLPHHGSTFARLLLDATAEFCGPPRSAALLDAYRAQRVRVGRPPRAGPDGRLRYGWDERLRLGRGAMLRLHLCELDPPGRDGASAVELIGTFEGADPGGAHLRVRAAGSVLRVATRAVWHVSRDPQPHAASAR